MLNEETKSIDHIIELNVVTKVVCDFFKQHSIFYSENRGFPSYITVRGRNPVEIPDGAPLSTKIWPVDNENPKDVTDAVHACEKLGRKLLSSDKKQDVTVLSRHFMIEGGTLPIKVSYSVGAPRMKHPQGIRSNTTEALYVKQMNLNRLFLGTLYHLMVGRNYDMAFSESSVVERETKGPTILEAYQKTNNFLGDPRVRRELVRLSLVAYFLSLYDMDNGANIVLDPWQRFDVIDFDKAFWGRVPNPLEELINPFAYVIGNGDERKMIVLPYEKMIKHFTGKEAEALVNEEMDRIYHNLRRNVKVFHGIIELMSTFRYYNLAANELYSERDVISYFLRRYHSFMPR